MPQSLTQLPEKTEFRVGGHRIIIRDNRVVNWKGLFDAILWCVMSSRTHRDTLYQFDKHGISCEMAIECCAEELDGGNTEKFANLIGTHYEIKRISGQSPFSRSDEFFNISKSGAGRIIVDQLIEKIRNCDDWGELYDELHLSSRFQKEIKKKIEKEMII